MAIFLILIVSSLVWAEDRGSSLFAGGGLLLGNSDLSLASGASAKSKFLTQGFVAEAGSSVGARSGVQGSLELGQQSSRNKGSNQGFFEFGDLDFYTVKAAFFTGPLTLGGGYRHNELTVRSLTATPSVYEKTDYSGWTPMVYSNLTISAHRQFMSVIEGQYVWGKLNGGSGLAPINYSEMSISLRVFITFD